MIKDGVGAKSAPIPQIGLFQLIMAVLMVPLTYVLVGLGSLFAVGVGAGICTLCCYLVFCAHTPVRIGVYLLVAALISGLAAITGAVAAIGGFWKGLRRPSTPALAIPVSLAHEKALADFILSISQEMKTRMPGNVLMEARGIFGVTQVKVHTGSGSFRGRTLMLALPFFPYLTQQELRAVLVHEFAHFTGRDTLYSTFVGPAFEGLEVTARIMKESLEIYDGWHGVVAGVALWPPIATLDASLKAFDGLNLSIQRKREIRADLIAARLCGSQSLAAALRKIYALDAVYSGFLGQVVGESLKTGCGANFFTLFQKLIKDHPDLIKQVDVATRKASDTPDSIHPSLKLRLHLIEGTSPEVANPRVPASALLADIRKQENALAKLVYFQAKL